MLPSSRSAYMPRIQAVMPRLLPCEILFNRKSEFLSWQLNPSDFDQVMLWALCPHRGPDRHYFPPPTRPV